MPSYFAGCATVTETKSLYRRLAMQYHPDHGGSTQVMQEINRQYHEALQGKHESHERGSDGEQHVYYYNQVDEQAIIDKLAELLHLDLPGCEIWLIGKWLWVQGDTRPVKNSLKAAGMSWHSKRIAWYWRVASGWSHYNPNVDLDDLAAQYGCKTFKTTPHAKPAGLAA